MGGEAVAGGPRARWLAPLSLTAEHGKAVGRGLVLFALAALGLVPLAGPVLIVVYLVQGTDELVHWLGGTDSGGSGPILARLGLIPVLVIVVALPAVRWVSRLTRSLASKWCGVAIAVPYRPLPGDAERSLVRLLRRRAWWVLADPANWHDLLWLLVAACGGFLLVAVPAGVVLYGFVSAFSPLLVPGAGVDRYLADLVISGPGAVPVGLAAIALGLLAAPRLLRGYGVLARSLLGPTRGSRLAQRVTHLAKTRSDTLDASALELRRIERDLHDGAQARLVAMGMTLEVADQLVDTDPAAARALLAEIRDSSVKALAELRDLVRGIHPPVLADRGLVAAINALALDSPVRVRVDGDLPGRPSPPVESATYFAVSELLANAAKHAEASAVWIDIRHESGLLRIGVTDDGIGGADIVNGSGLRGIERRLAAFDGVLAVSSPPGGPTVANMELACELSSPKTTSC
jgi:signal transduction histidine kinase